MRSLYYVPILLMFYIRFNFAYYLNHPNKNEPKEFFLRRNLEESADTFVAAKGKRVALFQVHFEGNVGDQMETIPLLRKLHEWGAIVDCYLSVWLPVEQRLNPNVLTKVSGLVNEIYVEGVPFDHVLRSRNYDLAISAPGPTVNEIKHCFTSDNRPDRNVSMAYFGISFNPSQIEVYEKQKSCLKLVAVREDQSYDFVKLYLPKENENILVLSGDISFSYFKNDYVQPDLKNSSLSVLKAVNYMNKQDHDWVLIFTRFNNFGPGRSVNIVNNTIIINSISGNIIKFNLKHILIGSSDRIMDKEHFKNLKKNYNLNSKQLCTVDTVEEMFALISSASHVYTDRYHPGVASIILNKKLTIISYPTENVKMQGLQTMKNVPNSSIKEMNRKAFDMLKDVFRRLDRHNGPTLKKDDKESPKHLASPSNITIHHKFIPVKSADHLLGNLSHVNNISNV